MPELPLPREIPFSLQDVRDEFDRLVDKVWHGGLQTAPLDGQDWAPRINVIEEPDRYVLHVELPGLTAEDTQVSILDGRVTIRGTKPQASKPSEAGRYLRRECRHGSFCRRFEFPNSVEEDGIAAVYRNGVLDITIPKKPEIQGRPVKIASED